jgi:Protein of unknown function (DUF2490)
MKRLLVGFFLFLAYHSFAQNDRVNDYNNINWAQLFVTKSINKKTDWLIEYQWRRTNGLKHWQQGLFRTAIQYKPNSNVALAVGYAQAETFAYGDYPIANNGTFPEHRLFEQVLLKQSLSRLSISHRFRIEQRFIGRVKAGTDRDIEKWIFSNRFRYLLKLQYPLSKNFYGWCGDELLISAGKNVGVNIFDQNRIHLNLGYKINSKIAVELGYINQTLQQGRRVNNSTIVQRNNGIVASTSLVF